MSKLTDRAQILEELSQMFGSEGAEPMHDALLSAAALLRDHHALVHSVPNAGLDAGAEAVNTIAPGMSSKAKRNAMRRGFDAMAGFLAARARHLAGMSAFGLRPEVLAMAHEVEARLRSTKAPSADRLVHALSEQASQLFAIANSSSTGVLPRSQAGRLADAGVAMSATLVQLHNLNGLLNTPDYADLADVARARSEIAKERASLFPASVYIVTRTSGAYDEYSEDIIACYCTEQRAHSHARLAADWWADHVDAARATLSPSDLDAIAKTSPFDPCQLGAGPRSYFASELAIDRDLPASNPTLSGDSPDVA